MLMEFMKYECCEVAVRKWWACVKEVRSSKMVYK